MPETISREMLLILAGENAYLAEQRRAEHSGQLVARDSIIRRAHDAGASFHELAKATGLSRAQVQRICDLSKGGNER